MKERPIIFSASMVRALLDGTKTQTRRVVKGSENWPKNTHHVAILPTRGAALAVDAMKFTYGPEIKCPYGMPGDRLWVRENGWDRPERTPKMMREGADTWAPYYYDADITFVQDHADLKAWGFKRRPSIHMPRWACRILLEITGVRIERLQAINEMDCRAEGCLGGPYAIPGDPYNATPREQYFSLWEELNGARSWELNPWVWVIEFKAQKI